MKHQALFSSKDKSNRKIEVSSAAIFVWCFKGQYKLVKGNFIKYKNLP